MVYRQQLPFWPLILISFAWILSYLPLPILLSTIGAITAFILLIRRTWLIWVGIAALLPVTSGLKIGLFSATDLLLLTAVACWFAEGTRQRTLHLQIGKRLNPLIYALLLYIGILTLSALNATNLAEAIAEVFKWVEVLIVLLLVPQMLPPDKKHWLVAALLLGAIGQSLLGLYQFINQIGPPWFMILDRFMRASGSFSQPNPFAGYLGLTLPVAVSLFIWSWQWSWQTVTKGEQGQQEDKKPLSLGFRQLVQLKTNSTEFPLLWMLFYGMAAALIALAMVASWSRGGWLGALVGVGVIFVLLSRRFLVAGSALISILLATFLAGGLSTNILASVIPAPIMARMKDLPAYFGLADVLNQPLTNENFAVVERMAHWVAAIRMWKLAPWLGVGPGNYEEIYPSVRLPFWEEALGHAHNIYLNTLGETGIIGFVAYLILWVTVVMGCVKMWQRKEGKRDDRMAVLQDSSSIATSTAWNRALALGILGVVMHLAVHNFFDNLFVQGMYLHIGFWLALLYTDVIETGAT